MTPPLSTDENITEGLGRQGATDPQLLFAAQSERVLITHNSADFGMLHEALALWAREWGVSDQMRHAGVLIIDQASTPGGDPRIRLMLALVRELLRQVRLVNRLFAWNPRQGLHEIPDAAHRGRRPSRA